MQLIESDLLFEFDHQWIVKSFDKQAYYRWLSGTGLKGVDFIGIYKGEYVVLFEIKNYRIRYKNYHPKIDFPQLRDAYQTKLRDSLKVIRIISKYHQRKWLFRKLQSLFYWLGPKWASFSSWGFWSTIDHITNQGEEQIIYVAWLELRPEMQQATKDIRRRLLQELQSNIDINGPAILLADCDNLPFEPSMKVHPINSQ